MANQTITVAYVADFVVSFPLTAGQTTTTASTGSWYPLGNSMGSKTDWQVVNGLKYSVLNIKVLSALTTDLSFTYNFNGTVQQTTLDVNYFDASLQNPSKLNQSITFQAGDTIEFLAYPNSTVTTAATETVTLSILVEPLPK